MNKVIYFIDDSISQMISVMNGQFPELWFCKEAQEGIKTKTIIFGNGYNEFYSEGLYSEEEEIDFQQKMGDLLYKECRKREMESSASNLYCEKSALIENAVNIVFKKNTEEDKLKLYQEIDLYWKNVIKKEQVSLEAEQNVAKLIELMEFEPNACVGIDMKLLYGDIERAKDEKPTISMELYHQIEQKHKCFLYSSATYDGKFVEKWKETYREIYKSNIDDGVFKKLEMIRKKHNSYEFDKIIKLLKEE